MTKHPEFQAEYFRGLQNLRNFIQSVETDIDKLKYDHYENPEGKEDVYETSVKDWNTKLLYCNSKLRKNRVKLEVLDGDIKFVMLINKVKEITEKGQEFDPEVTTFLMEFWEKMKEARDKLKSVLYQFQTNIWSRLQASCISYQGGQVQLVITRDYTHQVASYTKDIGDLIEKAEGLLKSFENGLNQEFFTESSFVHRLLINCDQKAFPVLRLVPDVTEKLMRVCALSRQWVDRDEQYVRDINQHLRETRSRTRKKAQHLKNQQELHTQCNQSLTQAYELFNANKTRLNELENEVKVLQREIVQQAESKKYKAEEKRQKEGIVGFLEISISQTKKNYNLQMKRARLLKQLQDLEGHLKELEVDIRTMERTLTAKTKEKKVCEEKVEQSSVVCDGLNQDFDKMCNTLNQLEKEVMDLTDSLTQLEAIQTVKTSPERVDDFFERPSTIKLAPSLKEKIMQRKRKLQSRLRHY